jgi:hypothetical protein
MSLDVSDVTSVTTDDIKRAHTTVTVRTLSNRASPPGRAAHGSAELPGRAEGQREVDLADRRYRQGGSLSRRLSGAVEWYGLCSQQARFVPGAIDSLRSSLEWAGLDYDEGGLAVTCSITAHGWPDPQALVLGGVMGRTYNQNGETCTTPT